jgi:hypothetical protein
VHGFCFQILFSESENGTAASHICSRMFLERRIGFPARSWRHQGKKKSYRGRIQNSFFVYLVGELSPLSPRFQAFGVVVTGMENG